MIKKSETKIKESEGRKIINPKGFDLKTYYDEIQGSDIKGLIAKGDTKGSIYKKLAYVNWVLADTETRKPQHVGDIPCILELHINQLYRWQRTPDFEQRLLEEIHKRGTGVEGTALFYKQLLDGVAAGKIAAIQTYQKQLEKKNPWEEEKPKEYDSEVKQGIKILERAAKLKAIPGGRAEKRQVK